VLGTVFEHNVQTRIMFLRRDIHFCQGVSQRQVMLSPGWESHGHVGSFPALPGAELQASGLCPAVPRGMSGKLVLLFLLGKKMQRFVKLATGESLSLLNKRLKF